MMQFHHTGCLVEDIEESIGFYKKLFGDQKVSVPVLVSSQGVYVCFVEVGEKVYLELIQPVDETSVVFKLKSKNVKYYHVAYSTSEFDTTMAELEKEYFKVLNVFNSEAFQNKRCAFLYAPDGSLIELLEIL
jgi:methylmalonyl-CoA/ethylmalonyl-CoA epimerase